MTPTCASRGADRDLRRVGENEHFLFGSGYSSREPIAAAWQTALHELSPVLLLWSPASLRGATEVLGLVRGLVITRAAEVMLRQAMLLSPCAPLRKQLWSGSSTDFCRGYQGHLLYVLMRL